MPATTRPARCSRSASTKTSAKRGSVISSEHSSIQVGWNPISGMARWGRGSPSCSASRKVCQPVARHTATVTSLATGSPSWAGTA